MRRLQFSSCLWIAFVICASGAAPSAVRAQQFVPQQAQQAPAGSKLQQALQQAALDGRPLLVANLRSTCPLCQAFKRRLTTDAALKPLLPSYSPVFCDTESPEDRRDLAGLRPLGGTLPFIYVVRADGHVVSATTDGSSDPELPNLLKKGIAESGIFMRPTDVPKFEAMLAQAKAAVDSGDVGQAVTLLVGLSGGQQPSFSKIVVDAQALLVQVKTRAKEEIGGIQSSLEGADKLASAVQLVDAMQKYAKLPEEQKTLAEMMKQFKSDAEAKVVLPQAEELVKARGHARQKRRDVAAQGYEKLIKRYPDSPIARLAQEELNSLPPAEPANAAKKRRVEGALPKN